MNPAVTVPRELHCPSGPPGFLTGELCGAHVFKLPGTLPVPETHTSTEARSTEAAPPPPPASAPFAPSVPDFLQTMQQMMQHQAAQAERQRERDREREDKLIDMFSRLKQKTTMVQRCPPLGCQHRLPLSLKSKLNTTRSRRPHS